MEKRDYLMIQIEQLGRALGQVLSAFLGLKRDGKTDEAMEMVSSSIYEHLDIDLSEWIHLAEDKFINFLLEHKKVNYAGLENIAEILYHTGIEKNREESFLYISKSLLLYEYIIRESGTFSLQWSDKINRLKQYLQNNEAMN